MAFTQLFTHSPDGDYTDNGSSIEFWVNGAGEFDFLGETVACPDDVSQTVPFFESEILSPRISLQPGEAYTFDIAWGMGQASGVPLTASEAGIVMRPATAVARAGTVEVNARVTPHLGGTLVCIARGEANEELARVAFGETRAGRAQTVDAILETPGAPAVELARIIHDGRGSQSRRDVELGL